MRLVMREGPGEVVVSYMWLPTFIGLNSAFMQRLENHVKPLLLGKDLTEETLDVAHGAVIDFIDGAFPDIKGLREYLDGIKFIEPAAP